MCGFSSFWTGVGQGWDGLRGGVGVG